MTDVFERLLVAVSGSEVSFIAARRSVLMARQYRCAVKAVYVVDTVALRQLTLTKVFLPDERDDYERRLRLDGRKHLARVVQWGVEQGVPVDSEIRSGGVWSEVVSAAKEYGADLIILGGVGTAYREIVADAPCSVLVVKEPAS